MYISLVTLLLAGLAAVNARAVDTRSASTAWPGWKGIKYAFIFGDSYTQTGFDYTKDPPTEAKPLGNPQYPGWTSSNGPNWVGFLTTKYNASRLLTYNLAFGGATVDSDLVTPWRPDVLSLKDQVLKQFFPGYVGAATTPATAPQSPKWTGADTLFAFWIGINDVGNTYSKGAEESAAINAKIFAVYEDLVVRLYGAGARNFLFLNVPPVDRSPLTIEIGSTAEEIEKADIAQFNNMIEGLARRLKTNHTDETNVFLYDTNKSFSEVLDKVDSHPQTAMLKNTTAYCSAYENGTPNQDTFTPSCGVPVNQYFWLNSLHPTYPMHEVVADGVAKLLEAGPNVV